MRDQEHVHKKRVRKCVAAVQNLGIKKGPVVHVQEPFGVPYGVGAEKFLLQNHRIIAKKSIRRCIMVQCNLFFRN